MTRHERKSVGGKVALDDLKVGSTYRTSGNVDRDVSGCWAEIKPIHHVQWT
jgi:hypothetical protein